MPAETAATTQWTLATIKAFLGTSVSTKDDDIVKIGDGVSAFLERRTHRKYVIRNITEARDGDGSNELFLRDAPVRSITSITVLRSPTDSAAEAMAATNYRTNTGLGKIVAHSDRFTAGTANVTVVYSCGYGTKDNADAGLPADLYEVGLRIVKLKAEEKFNSAIAATQMSMGPVNVILRPDWPKDIRDTIHAWTRAVI